MIIGSWEFDAVQNEFIGVLDCSEKNVSKTWNFLPGQVTEKSC